MKRHYKILLLIVAASVGLWSFMPKEKSSDPEKDKALLELLTYVLEKTHYHPANINDDFSKGVYKDYLKDLDASKRFFLQSDIDEFSKYQDKIDDEIKNKDLTFFDLTYNRLQQRIEEAKSYYKEALANPIDYSIDETINTDFDKLPYAKNVDELKERWKKQIKLSTLSSLVEKQKNEEDKLANKGKTPEQRLSDYKEKLSGRVTPTPEMEKKFLDNLKKNDTLAPKSYTEIEKETRDNALKSLDESFSNLKDLDREDWFSIFVNVIAERYDPHTSYFPPVEKEKFDVSMSGKFEGIGARLQKKNDYTEITELISGGPAWRGKQLEAGDIILKVAQGDAEPVDVVGMRIDDVVKKIKGPKGTEVRLTVKKTDGTIKVISIIRDEVELEETYVKSSIVESNGLKYGVIYLPKFYINFEDRNNRDAAKDMAQEIERLKKENVQGIVLDVRDNGGGSLSTVVDIAGLFIDNGPIVQVKNTQGNVEVLADRDPKIQWDGPLVIMTNSFSASASEILAAAMQDYKRAIIIGGKQTYGKGTVQKIFDLNQLVRGSTYGDLGAVKSTIQKFYRVNGGSTQREGVASDVVIPDRYEFLKMGERDEETSMPWDKIDPARYAVCNKNSKFDLAIANSKKRIETNSQIKLIDENAKWLDDKNKETVYSLKLDKFKEEQKKLEDVSKKYKVISKYKNNYKFTSLPYEVEQMKNDSALKDKRDAWHDNLSNDVYVEEAIRVLDDLQDTAPKKAIVQSKNKKTIKS